MPIGIYKRTKRHIKESISHLKHYYGKEHGMWKGSKVGFHSLHSWVSRHRGKPKFCEDCGKKNNGFYDWANISGKYKRDLKDYKRLCRHCHRVFDKKTKLNNNDIIKINELYNSGNYSQREIGNKFNVCQQLICLILNKKRWNNEFI